MNHRRSEFFSSGCFFSRADRNLVGQPVVFHHARMVDRNVRGALIEIGDGIAPSRHDRRHQVIRFRNSSLRRIDKAGLHGLPLLRIPLVFHRIEIANVELVNSLLAIR